MVTGFPGALSSDLLKRFPSLFRKKIWRSANTRSEPLYHSSGDLRRVPGFLGIFEWQSLRVTFCYFACFRVKLNLTIRRKTVMIPSPCRYTSAVVDIAD